MPNNDLRVYFNGNEVAIAGGFNHEKKGHMVEIVGVDEKIPRQSISIWELLYSNKETAMRVFDFCFGRTPKQAEEIDRKKGVLKETPPDFIRKREMALA